MLDRARDAQRDFELARRRLLPLEYGGGGRCDERIGRFCYWYDGREELPDEPEKIARLRQELLDTLAGYHAALPDDDWILGQQVRYLVEHEAYDRALDLTDGCAGWWCHALRGFAFHEAERFDSAEATFDRALALMPEALRCEWTDLRVVLEGKLADRLEGLDCRGREAAADSILWLADPFLSLPGNDLETELLSRRVAAWYLQTARSPHGMSFGKDIAELALRYGRSVRWAREDRGWPTAEPPSIIGHSRVPGYAFFPKPDDPGEDGAEWRYDLEPDRPRSRYAPVYAKRIRLLEGYRVARFARGDSMVLAVTGDPAEARIDGDGAVVRLAFSQGPGAAPLLADSPFARRGARLIRVPAVAGQLGVEIEAGSDKHWARARWLLAPLAGDDPLTVSDPLLFDPGDELPSGLAEAAGRALQGARLRRSSPVGVYWEVGGPESDSVEVSVALVPERRGLFGRIGQSLSLVKRRAPLTLQWTAERAAPVLGRSFELDLAELDTGWYTLLLTVTGRHGTERSTQLRIELTK
ncbi:MAG: hypothetical protein R2909_05855 [Gemmatimonadales bacterium]